MVTRNIVRCTKTASLFVWTLLLCAEVLAAQTTNETGANPTSCTVPKDEIAALDAIYGGHYDEPEVIVTKTQQWAIPDVVNLQLAARGRGLPLDLRKDFEEKNMSSCTVMPFISNRNVHFISAAEERRIFRIGWNEFYRRFGKNAGIDRISRVGFNSEKTLALVHVFGAAGANGAAGTLYLLQLNHKKWTIKFSMQIEAV
jgi:hypothetical protein